MDKWLFVRKEMVQKQLIRRGIYDKATLWAMEKVPRHLFVPPHEEEFAYTDGPLPIAEGQTISQPYIVALMAQTASINSHSTVLEIGTGSGYGAAILAELAKQVYTVEHLSALAERASLILKKLNYTNVNVILGDGSLGLLEFAPYDAILVTAAAPFVPPSLKTQLKIGGKLIIPIGQSNIQQLICLTRSEEDHYHREVVESVRFVPLIGKEGWPEKF